MNKLVEKIQRKKFDDAGIEVGDTITVSWDIDPAYAAEGQGERAHTGVLTCLDTMVCVKPLDERRGYLRLSLSSVKGVRLEAKAPPKKSNPFLELAKARGEI